MNITVFRNYNIEYPDDQIVCLNSFGRDDLYLLSEALKGITINNPLVLSEEGYVTRSGCRLILRISNDDIGLTEIPEKNGYECCLSSYDTMILRVHGFLNHIGEENMFNWLYDLDNPIDFLLSRNCKW